MAFQQAELRVERQQEFQELRGIIERATAEANIEEFLKQVKKAGLKVRNFESVLEKRVFEKVDRRLAASGTTTGALYETLALPDKSLTREFYLERIEKIQGAAREKYRQLYIDLV